METTIASNRRTHGFTYKGALRAARRNPWTIEDLTGPGQSLDFGRPFLPEALARVEGLPFLTPREKLVLNQIRAHGYLYTFGLVEEFILPFVLDHARPSLALDDDRTRALLQFAGEEAKHIQLFKRFREEFQRGFGTECEVIGPPEAVAAEVLSKPALSVALVILQIEWMTQRHYLDSVVDDKGIDDRFKSLLRHHWMEEAQHAQLDTLMVEELVKALTPEEREKALEGYLAIGGFLDAGLKAQAAFDLAAFERAAGRTLDSGDRARFLEQQHQALRWTFLGSGMTHARFLESLEGVTPKARATIEAVAASFR
jgi:hypothetical protein